MVGVWVMMAMAAAAGVAADSKAAIGIAGAATIQMPVKHAG